MLKGFESGPNASQKEELDKMVEHISNTIGAETARLKQLKTEYSKNVQYDEADEILLDAELSQMGAQQHLKNFKSTSALSDQASSFVNEVEKDIKQMVTNDGPSNLTREQKKIEARRRTELAMKLQDTVVDELDKMVAETNVGAGRAMQATTQNTRTEDNGQKVRNVQQVKKTSSQPKSQPANSQGSWTVNGKKRQEKTRSWWQFI